jgi:diguanylate cyclase (GGDEF)-like protein
MRQAIRVMPWAFVALGLALGLYVSITSHFPNGVWRVVIVAAGVAAAFAAFHVNKLPLLFPIAFFLAAIRLATLSHTPSQQMANDLSFASSLSDAVVGLFLVAMLVVAVRGRCGELSIRDVVDGVTVAFGASLISWLVIANPLMTKFDVSPGLAIVTAAYLPVAVLVFTFTLDLLFTGLSRNKGMLMIAGASTANLLAALLSALGAADVLSGNVRPYSVASFLVAFLLLCGGISHRDIPATLEPQAKRAHDHGESGLHVLLLAGSLMTPAGLIAIVHPTSTADSAVRTVGALGLVLAAIVRLYITTRSSAAAHNLLLHRLHHDELTDLPTRARFVECVDDILDETWRSEYQPTIVQLNLDRFKNINDSLGHSDANRVLKLVGQRLTEQAEKFDGIVGRSGGDDFVVIYGSTTSNLDAMACVDSIREAFATPIVVGESSTFVTASVGVAMSPRHLTLSAEELMRRADIATHRAKAEGRNRVVQFDESMHEHLTRRMDVEHALHGAIGRQEMRLYHQPIIDITTGQLSGFEALIRWLRSDGTLVPPGDFIPIAEETGIINEIGAWALREALTELRGWINDGVVSPTTTTSVNVSPRQIADPNFADVVRDALEQTGVSPHLLWIEMTESMMLEEPELAQSTLRHIRATGVRIALDDFGTGYSSLSLLQQFPIQRIKIDRAFVQGLGERSNDRSLVTTIIAMARSMGLDLVAEGVENVTQLLALRELGCDKAQGFMISHPVPAEAMRSTMSALDGLCELSIFSRAAEADRISISAGSGEFSSGDASDHAELVSGPSRPIGQPFV